MPRCRDCSEDTVCARCAWVEGRVDVMVEVRKHVRARIKYNQDKLRNCGGGSMTKYYRGSLHELRLVLDFLITPKQR